MNEQKNYLSDGEYSFDNGGVLTIINGKAEVKIFETFGMKNGVTIPLSRSEHNIKFYVPGGTTEDGVVLNGHAII